jgi:maltose/moltooligosaccharide transporter
MIKHFKGLFDTWWKKMIHLHEVSPEKFVCGTVRYTPATLLVLFGWLLWGDFTLTLMEATPGLVALQLKDYNISNTTMAILMGTMGTLCNFVLNPIISSHSDRFRSRWGRRRPFLIFATPFVALFLILLPWSPDITAVLLKHNWAQSLFALFPAAPLVIVFGVMIISFQVFNLFIATVYYYLIPDTVPEPFIGRFYGYFRVVGMTAGLIFSWFIFGYVHEHMRLIFAVFALIYAVSFILMCWKVREGEYPPIREAHGHWYAPIRNYVVECFGSTRYWLIFLVYAAGTQWTTAGNLFKLFFYRDEVGLTETDFGRLMAVTAGATLLFSVPFGVLVDRWGSQKSLMIGLAAGMAVTLAGFFIIHGRATAFVMTILMNLPFFLAGIAMGKWTVDMYPRAQYGQFASAGAMVGALGLAALSPMFGKIVDALGNYYRLFLLAPVLFGGVALVASIILYRWYGGEPTPEAVPGPLEDTAAGGNPLDSMNPSLP